MAFWGIEVKPGKPYIHRHDDKRGRLHISQATLGAGSSPKKSIVQCTVGDRKPIYLCSLVPENLETCGLNLELEEEEEVTISVLGPHSVHLSGFFYGNDEDQDNLGDDYDSDPYEEGTMETDSDEEDDYIGYDLEDEDEDDDYTDEDFGMYPPTSVPNSGVTIEEIVDDEKPTNENGMSKRAKKKKIQPIMPDENEKSNRQIVVKAQAGVPVLESEDEDGLPISARQKKPDISNPGAKVEHTNTERIGEKTQNNNEKVDEDLGQNLKRKTDDVGQDEELASRNNENEVKHKKNKKKRVVEKMESAPDSGMPNSNGTEQIPVAEIGNELKPSSEKKKEKKEKKKKKKQKQQLETVGTPNAAEKPTNEKGSVMEKQDKAEAKPLQVRSFPNGLVIEELAMGKPAGKRASPGKKVSVHYIGRLKKNGKIFDSNIGRAPFKFRLGIGEVIKGWDVGVNGMRIGDKRRLTVPPAMGYGSEGHGATIPPNSWLVFDVELVDVN